MNHVSASFGFHPGLDGTMTLSVTLLLSLRMMFLGQEMLADERLKALLMTPALYQTPAGTIRLHEIEIRVNKIDKNHFHSGSGRRL